MLPSGSPYASKKDCRQDIYSGFETDEAGHMKSKTGAISGSTKWALVQQNFKKNYLDSIKIPPSFDMYPYVYISVITGHGDS